MDTQGILGDKRERALARGTVKVFLSHKHKDVAAAKQIQEVLESNSGPMLDVFVSEDIPTGNQWQEEIENQLYDADWFMLIYTGMQNEDWAWCHHEAGLFGGMMYPEAKRVVVFYPPNVALPDPLKKYQSVLCEDGRHEEIYRFFDAFFGIEPYPGFRAINPGFAGRASPRKRDDAQTIIDAVGCLVVKSLLPEDSMIIHIPDKVVFTEQKEFPKDTQILRGSGGMRLFDLGAEDDFLWPEFQEALSDEVRACLNQSFWPAIHQACVKSIRSRRLAATHTVLRSPRDGHHYMPMLSRAEIAGNNSATFHITFVQVAMGTQADVRDKSVARIFTALNLAHRFRWEVIDPYRDLPRLQEFVERHPADSGDGETSGHGGLAAIWDAISMIEAEAQVRGVQDQDALPADFGPGASEEVRAMFPFWSVKRQELQDAVQADDVVSFSRVLAELDPMNVRFVSLAAHRLGELVQIGAPRSS